MICKVIVLQSLKFLDWLQNEIDNFFIEDVVLLTVNFHSSVLSTWLSILFSLCSFPCIPHSEEARLILIIPYYIVLF